eukprot:EST43586.1 Hypothetical protein SS50377_16627 [Spironucleus salmonicida]
MSKNTHTQEQLLSFPKEKLVEIILKLQAQVNQIPELENQLAGLRTEVAEQYETQELCEENELNTFRRLSEQCVAQGLEVQSSGRAGASVDQVGSLSNVVARRDVSFVGSLSNGAAQPARPNQVQIGSMAPAIQSMSASLTSQAYTRQMNQPATQPLLLGSFSQTGASQRSGFNPLSAQVQQSGAPKPNVQQQRVNILAVQPATLQEESDDVELVM